MKPKFSTARLLVSLVFFTTLLSCAPSKENYSPNLPCNENPKFKKAFFNNIQIVDNFLTKASTFKTIDELEAYYTEEKVASYNKALEFISTYSKVSFESMFNYDRSYPYGVYQEDRKNWLEWYDNNKCLNIQFADSIPK